MTADEVECQIKIALEWLRGERIEYRRFAAVLILKEMAENASTVFNVHVPEFVDAIWVALRDPVLPIRERAVEALRACLGVIEKRETRWRVQWYYRMFEATQDGLGKNASVHSIHGSLLADPGELHHFLRDRFVTNYVETCMNHILGCFTTSTERKLRASGFIALGRWLVLGWGAFLLFGANHHLTYVKQYVNMTDLCVH
ncbi:hypothetical protein M0R45_000516 [Rubus argutus]|uniref:Uncharacterized protein n=1 Tax=Rubus argutus TaxID=59490 RepID=A0AAW1VKF6_RUBAR